MASQRDPLFRLSAKAIIIEDDALLTVHCADDEGAFHTLPGGGQEYGESVHAALIRECQEEVACTVEPGPLLFVRDYLGWQHEFADIEGHVHQVELMFRCTIGAGRPGPPSVADGLQVGFAWVPLAALPTVRFYPMAMRVPLVDAIRQGSTAAIYLGAVN
jgi:ADP-ribose pyrophosphatase YjhB (NUDIX family)